MIAALAILLFTPLLICWGLWFLFALAAALPDRKRPAADSTSRAPFSIDILIPAHDEELLLPRLLATLRQQTAPGALHSILVVADHCTDHTADLARQAGASVLERNTGPHGKPAALRDGLAWLNDRATVAPAPRAVLILDADCTVSPNLLEEVVAAMDRGAAVVQAAYLLESPPGAHSLHAPAAIAFALKNIIRPAGMNRLGLPTQLFGTGMCFRADLLNLIPFEDHLTEDLAMSHHLLLRGIRPTFIRNAIVRSPLPSSAAAMSTQKLRWETGQITTWSTLPRIWTRLIVGGHLRAAVALLDWSAPPLALAILYWLGATFAMVLLVAYADASAWVLLFPAIAALVLAGYVIAGGLQSSGPAAVGRLFLGAPKFALWKIGLYGKMLLGHGAKTWQRTPRQNPEPVVRK